MRRFLVSAVATSLLTLTGSATALAAHHGKRHHRAHHAARHRHHHARGARLLRFGVAAFTTSGAPIKSPGAPSGENAGTVKSFTGGVLTITLTDETVVSGKVTPATRLECESATAPQGGQDDDEQGDDNEGDDDNQGDEQDSATARLASNDSGDDDEQGGEACTTEALVPGAVVREAELSVSSAGAVWEEVELVK
ncbi:MAG: hypothetical protein E6G34_05400 [Actinobacteria bacterium]|nr:MAG: hypothetical protein E6G34_05400 [Actinomycetota bacterium]